MSSAAFGATENRWLPPSPHKEKVLEWIGKGLAHIEERGHNIPPILVFEWGGGAMELPLVRFSEEKKNFVPAGTPLSAGRQTSYCDVCGAIGELKEMVGASGDGQADRERLLVLLADASYMVSRMSRRRDQYRAFAVRLREIAGRMEQIPGPEVSVAERNDAEIRGMLEPPGPEAAQEIVERAEAIRRVAGELENAILEHKKTAIEVHALYRELKGSRDWSAGEDARGA
jgi:hypothetical protein